MNLSITSLKELRASLEKTYGKTFVSGFSDSDLNEIGMALLTVTAEHLKLKARIA